jgi:hypothetical protein
MHPFLGPLPPPLPPPPTPAALHPKKPCLSSSLHRSLPSHSTPASIPQTGELQHPHCAVQQYTLYVHIWYNPAPFGVPDHCIPKPAYGAAPDGLTGARLNCQG